jgi:hypothetical protein
VSAVAAAVRAVLLQLKAIRVVTPVLLGDVVPVLALLASQRDLGPDIGGSHVECPLVLVFLKTTVSVAEAGLEPATQRL